MSNPNSYPTATILVIFPTDSAGTIYNWTKMIGPKLVGGAAGCTSVSFVLQSPCAALSLTPGNTSGTPTLSVTGSVNIKFSFPQASLDDATLPAFYPIGISLYSVKELNAGTDKMIQNTAQVPMNGVDFDVDTPAPAWPSYTGAPVQPAHYTPAPNAPYLVVPDACTLKGPRGGGAGAGTLWGFTLVFQDNYGTIGVIDPFIENDTN